MDEEKLVALNDDKTEFLIITTKHRMNTYPDVKIKIGDSDIIPSLSACNLGVIFDSKLSHELHVNSICKKAYSQIRAIGSIRKYLDKPSTEKLVNSLVTVHLDYCNSLLYGISSQHMCRLQKIQNRSSPHFAVEEI